MVLHPYEREPRVNLDWGRLKAVVLESDDWGLCAWVPDDQAHRALVDAPAWRGPAGRIYGRSTLETASDVERLCAVLDEFRGGDGLAPLWQANTILAAPDFARLVPPLFEIGDLPLLCWPDAPPRWRRPGLWERVERGRAAGLWWPELHGLHHVPAAAWLNALRRGAADARRAHQHESIVCQVSLDSSEYDAGEPVAQRARNLDLALERFRALFGVAPASLCPPNYRWDDWLETRAEEVGLILQGKSEQAGRRWPRLGRLLDRYRWPDARGGLFAMPPRIAFEPRGTAGGLLGAEAVHREVWAAWRRGQPAVVSTHRVNYAHLDPPWSESGRAALRDLLSRLAADGARFMIDAEVGSLVQHGWSLRPVGERGAVLRFYGVPGAPLQLAAPAGVSGLTLRQASSGEEARATLEGSELRVNVNPGEYRIEWVRA